MAYREPIFTQEALDQIGRSRVTREPAAPAAREAIATCGSCRGPIFDDDQAFIGLCDTCERG